MKVGQKQALPLTFYSLVLTSAFQQLPCCSKTGERPGYTKIDSTSTNPELQVKCKNQRKPNNPIITGLDPRITGYSQK